MLALIVADAYIPERQESIPSEFAKLMLSGKIDQVITLGNINTPTKNSFLMKVAKRPVKCVMGESDVGVNNLETSHIFTVGEKRIGMISGFLVTPMGDIDVLTAHARDMNVDILLWGGSHTQELDVNAGHVFINPGSVSGASAMASDECPATPGFCLLEMKNDESFAYMYRMENGNIKVEKAKLPI